MRQTRCQSGKRLKQADPARYRRTNATARRTAPTGDRAGGACWAVFFQDAQTVATSQPCPPPPCLRPACAGASGCVAPNATDPFCDELSGPCCKGCDLRRGADGVQPLMCRIDRRTLQSVPWPEARAPALQSGSSHPPQQRNNVAMHADFFRTSRSRSPSRLRPIPTPVLPTATRVSARRGSQSGGRVPIFRGHTHAGPQLDRRWRPDLMKIHLRGFGPRAPVASHAL